MSGQGIVEFTKSISLQSLIPVVAEITPATSTLCIGSTLQLSNATSRGTWSSSNSSNTGIATINEAGLVTGVEAGKVTITYSFTSARGCSNMATKEITVEACNVATVCAYGQGHWFNNGVGNSNTHVWGCTVTLGGKTYTEAEGRAIEAASSSSKVKQSFIQASALYLSFCGRSIPAELQGYLTTINAYFTLLPRLTPGNVVEDDFGKTDLQPAANAAAGKIAEWIKLNECK